LLDPLEFEGGEDILRINRSKEKHYAFDYAFEPSRSTDYIFECTSKSLIESVSTGYNGTVFAYGATGAGKTFT
jgi:kinesin family member 18/19